MYPICMDLAIARAQAYVDALAARCAADPQRPRCHLLPPSRWMNDPNGTIRHGGWYHVFYQLNPFGDGWGFMHWGHARSRDLVRWEHLPIALAPDVLAGEEHCFSGCIAIDADGTPRLIYTSVPFADARPCEQWSATPLDAELIAWQRERTPLIGAQSDRAARDPFVFRWQGRTFAVLGDGRRVALFEAPGGELGRLEPAGTLWEAVPDELQFAECPNVLPLADGRIILLLSPYRPVEWRLGGFDGRSMTVQAQGRLDLHDSFYATNTLEDAEGRTVVVGWIRHFPGGRGWSGCLALPRLVEVAGNELRQRVHPAAEALIAGPAQRWSGVPLAVGDACRVRATIPAGASLRIGRFSLTWDGTTLGLCGGSHALAVHGELELDIWTDRSVIEVFIAGGREVLTRVDAATADDGMLVLAGAGSAEAWRLSLPAD